MKKLFLRTALSFIASLALLAVAPIFTAQTDAYADSHSCSCKGEEDCTCETEGCADEECAKHCDKCGEKKCSCGEKEHASSHEEEAKTESCH